MNPLTLATKPEFSWKGDSTTGLYHPGAGQIGLSVSGIQNLNLSGYALNTYSLQYGLTVNAPVNASYPNIKIDFPNTTYTIAAASSYGYVLTYHGTDNFYVLGSGDVHYKGGWVGSDSSIKKNIVTVPNALKKINKLRGVNFNYNYPNASLNDPNELALGLIAQEVQRVVPEAVKMKKDGTLSVNYASLVGLLIEGMKEQNKRLDSLKQQLAICCPTKTGQRTSSVVPTKQDSIIKNLQDQINNCCSKVPQGSSNQNTAGNGTPALFQNIPNPFNQTTNIKCFIPDASKTASLLIFDLNGTLKKTIPINSKGEVNVTINAKELLAGMYNYSLIIDNNEIDTKKMILTEQ
jgi:hypothetical protein